MRPRQTRQSTAAAPFRAPSTNAIYARFSSERQRETSIDDQVRRCRAHLEREGVPGDAISVFSDYAMSGSSLDRPGFEALMRAVDDGRIERIVTEDVSRISRDFADAAIIFRRLQFARVPLVSIADGIDTSDKHAKLTFALKSLVADIYLDDLRDKTLRGLEGRALAGFATGLVPFGYRTAPETDSRGRELGKRVVIVDAEATVVRRIFDDYLAGGSLGSIARSLNLASVPSPRVGTRHKRFGWGPSTIRAILYNEKYAGTWRFKERQWVRVPGSSKRLPRARPAADVMTFDRPELRLIDAETFAAVQRQLRAVHRRYTVGVDGEGPPARQRRESRYVLSGVLVCERCGAPMQVTGSSTTYYRCTESRKATCDNRLSLREDVLLAAVREFLLLVVDGPEVAAERTRLMKTSRGRAAHVDAEIRVRRDALREAEQRIAHLVERLAATRSDYIATALRELEELAAAERAALERLRRTARDPVVLPAPADLKQWIAALGARGTDIAKSRARLASFFEDQQIKVARSSRGAKLTAWFAPEALLRDRPPSPHLGERAYPLGFACIVPAARPVRPGRARLTRWRRLLDE